MGDFLQAIDANVADHATDAANVAVILQYAAAAGIAHIIPAIVFSYSDVPAGGRLTVVVGANTIVDIDITEAGPARLPFEPHLRGSVNTALTITLAAGGPGVIGKVNAPGHYTQG